MIKHAKIQANPDYHTRDEMNISRRRLLSEYVQMLIIKFNMHPECILTLFQSMSLNNNAIMRCNYLPTLDDKIQSFI